jgi:tetratricopeptide (TPR) repeat protein
MGNEARRCFLFLTLAGLLLAVPAGSEQAQGSAQKPTAEELRTEFRRAVELVQGGQYDAAEAAFKALLAREPSLPEVHYNLGYLRGRRRDWSTAEAEFRQALVLRPGYREARDALAHLYQAREEKVLEREVVTKSATPDPEYAPALRKAADLADAGRLDESQAAFEALLRKHPTAPEIHFDLGFVFSEKKDRSAAEQAYRKAIEVKPDYGDAHLALARLLTRSGQADRAYDALNEGAAKAPGDARIPFQIGLNRIDALKNEEAEAALLRAEALDPSAPETQYRLAYLAIGANRNAEGIARLEKYLSMTPRNLANVETAKGLLAALQKRK